MRAASRMPASDSITLPPQRLTKCRNESCHQFRLKLRDDEQQVRATRTAMPKNAEPASSQELRDTMSPVGKRFGPPVWACLLSR